MKKIAYIIDSASFINKEDALNYDLFFVPLHILVGEVDYLEGDNLDKSAVINAIKNKQNVTTSQPSPGEIIHLIDNLKDQGYECGIFASIGSKLSRTIENVVATSAMEDFKMYSIDSQNVGYIQRNALLKTRSLIEKESMSIEDAIREVEKDIALSTSLIVPDDLFHLSRGGRITKAAAALGSMLKIKPVLEVLSNDGGKIDAVDKVRTSKKALRRMIELAFIERNTNDFEVLVAHFDAREKAEELVLEILDIMPELKTIEIVELTTVIGVHTGLNCVGIQMYKKF